MTAVSSSPLRASPCHAKVRIGHATVASRDLAREVNKLGFEQLSRLGDTSGVPDIIVSPFAIWYLNQFLDSNWRDRRDAPAPVLLDELRNSASFSATVWAKGGKSTYTIKDAARAQHVLCASTKWFPWGVGNTNAAILNPLAYDFSVTLSLKTDFAFRAVRAGSTMRVPFFDDGSLRGIRLDSKDGTTAAYLFWASNERIASFRKTMDLDTWESLARRFKEANVLFEDISLQRSSYNEWLPDGMNSFGTALSPGFSLQHALLSNEALTIDRDGARLTLTAAMHGYSTKPISVTVNGRTEYQGTDHTIISDPSWSVPSAQRFSMLKPLAYVIENRSTGTILLIGIHE